MNFAVTWILVLGRAGLLRELGWDGQGGAPGLLPEPPDHARGRKKQPDGTKRKVLVMNLAGLLDPGFVWAALCWARLGWLRG